MKTLLIVAFFTFALANGQLNLEQLGDNRVQIEAPRLSSASVTTSSSNANSNGSTFLSWMGEKVSEQLDRLKNLSSWLIRNDNKNYVEHSDKVDAKIGSEERGPGGLKSVNGGDSPLNMAETLFREGRNQFSQSNTIRLLYESVGGLGSCLANNGFEDRDLGSMPLNASLYCAIGCLRNVPGITCCAPQSPDLIDPKLLFFRRGNKTRVLNWRNPDEASDLQTESGRIVWVVHGWIEKISFTQWITDMVEGYTSMGDGVIVVDWRGGNSIHYWQASANIRTVGAVIGHAIGTWDIADRTLFVGFSLGGQMIGETARYLQRRFGQKMAECHGLDPAGPFFDGCSDEIRMDKDDCKLTLSVHTSASDVPNLETAVVRFGTQKKSAHCDYWLNCGFNQGPCIDMAFPEFIKSVVRLGVAASDGEMANWVANRLCSHWRAPEAYNAVLLGNASCPAYDCPNCGQTRFCVPSRTTRTKNGATNYLAPFTQCSPDMDVSYYVYSGSYKPYCDRPE